MTTLERMQAFLNMSDNALMICISLYNAGKLSKKSRFALEALEAMFDADQKLIERRNIPWVKNLFLVVVQKVVMVEQASLRLLRNLRHLIHKTS